jgi:hypothetical protein
VGPVGSGPPVPVSATVWPATLSVAARTPCPCGANRTTTVHESPASTPRRVSAPTKKSSGFAPENVNPGSSVAPVFVTVIVRASPTVPCGAVPNAAGAAPITAEVPV